MPIDPERLMTASLRRAAWGSSIARILAASLEAVEPGKALACFMKRSGNQLTINGTDYDLSRFRRVLVVGAGKAGAPMAAAAASILGHYLTTGLVIVKEGHAQVDVPSKIQVFEAGHPIPDDRGLQASRHLVELLKTTGKEDLVICLLSGGGSALLSSPAEGITLQDMQSLTSALLRSGANIQELNAVRKHLEVLKGGGLARLAAPAAKVTLILSDVVGDPLDVIASGPTAPDRTTYVQAYDVLKQYDLLASVSPGILDRLQRGMGGQIPETPKEGDLLFKSVKNVIVASNFQAAHAALDQAHQEGFHTLLLTTYLQGEARQAGRVLAAIARQIDPQGQPITRPACLVSGGETTVTVTGKGLGGRNQEVALGAVTDLAGIRDIALVTLATDGGDGPTDAAGAVVTGETYKRAASLGLKPGDFLAANDSYHFFEALGDLLRPGPTMTNVNDLTFVFAF